MAPHTALLYGTDPEVCHMAPSPECATWHHTTRCHMAPILKCAAWHNTPRCHMAPSPEYAIRYPVRSMPYGTTHRVAIWYQVRSVPYGNHRSEPYGTAGNYCKKVYKTFEVQDCNLKMLNLRNFRYAMWLESCAIWHAPWLPYGNAGVDAIWQRGVWCHTAHSGVGAIWQRMVCRHVTHCPNRAGQADRSLLGGVPGP